MEWESRWSPLFSLCGDRDDYCLPSVVLKIGRDNILLLLSNGVSVRHFAFFI